jgi:hypothetical protein
MTYITYLSKLPHLTRQMIHSLLDNRPRNHRKSRGEKVGNGVFANSAESTRFDRRSPKLSHIVAGYHRAATRIRFIAHIPRKTLAPVRSSSEWRTFYGKRDLARSKLRTWAVGAVKYGQPTFSETKKFELT